MCEISWHSVAAKNLEGAGWADAAKNFARLPDKAQTMVTEEIWHRSRHSAGLCVRFRTNSKILHADWSLKFETLALPRMQAASVSGLDLYVREPHGYVWAGLSMPEKLQQSQSLLVGELDGASREFLLYLPLYNSFTRLAIGTEAGCEFEFLPPRSINDERGIVFYGTSITQGGSASRSGMNHVAQIGRALDWPVINLGIGGNARMELAMAELVAELDPTLFVIDCRANMSAEQIDERYVPFVHRLRELRSDTPILLSKGCKLCDSVYVASRRKWLEDSWAAIERAWQQLKSENVPGLHYLSEHGQLGDDNLATTDGIHPSDLGFYHQTRVILAAIKDALVIAD